MDLKDSAILKNTVGMLFPFIAMFGFYLTAYGANFPGGGFQAGVVFGTIVIVVEMVFGRRIFENSFYMKIEFLGILFLFGSLIAGFLLTDYFFSGLYSVTTSSPMFANVFYSLLNLAIYSEVSGSLILIYRSLIEWKGDEPYQDL
jgi:multicomponent Na+:H+ antiporter subunit B